MINYIYGICFFFCVSISAQALDVGDISSFMNSDTDIISKDIRNKTDTGRLVSVRIERITSPLDEGMVVSMETPDEMLLSPARLVLPAKSGDIVRFFYKGPADNKERYYRIVWLEQTLIDTPREHLTRSAVVTTSVSIGTILVVAPRKVNFRYQYSNGKIINNGNATLRVLAYGPCLPSLNKAECKENYFLMPGKTRRFSHVNVDDKNARVALWQGEQFIPVK